VVPLTAALALAHLWLALSGTEIDAADAL
jgi:hypothetical protein